MVMTALLQGQAGANMIPIVVSNRIGRESVSPDQSGNLQAYMDFYGNSFICGPEGEVLKSAQQQEGFICSTLNLTKTSEQRSFWGIFR